MKDIIEYLVRKYGYAKTKQPSISPTIINKRIRRALEHHNLFYDKEKGKLRAKLISRETDLKYIFKFLQEKGLGDEYKKKCLKELIINPTYNGGDGEYGRSRR